MTTDRTNYRQIHIPKGALKVADKGSDAVVYVFNAAKTGAPCGIAFHGKAGKPDWNYRFKNVEQREKYITKYFSDRRTHLARIAEQKAKDKSVRNFYEVGHILMASWGYEQTNIDWFQVVRVTPRCVIVRAISGTTRPDGGYMTGKTVPNVDNFKGPEILCRVGRYGSLRIDDVRYASLWNGEAASYSSYA